MSKILSIMILLLILQIINADCDDQYFYCWHMLLFNCVSLLFYFSWFLCSWQNDCFLETLTLFMQVNLNCFMITGYKLQHLLDFFFKWSIQMYYHFYGNLVTRHYDKKIVIYLGKTKCISFWKTRFAIHFKEWNYNLNWTIIMCMMFLAFLL